MGWKRLKEKQKYIPRFRFLNHLIELDRKHTVGIKNSRTVAAIYTVTALLGLNVAWNGYFKAVDKFGPTVCRRDSTAYAEKVAPFVVNELENHYGVQLENIDFDRNPSREDIEDANERRLLAAYSTNTEKITIYLGSKAQCLSFGLFGADSEAIREAVAHEIAHDYLGEFKAKENIDWTLNDADARKLFISDLLEEGIASHFEVFMGREEKWEGKILFPRTDGDLDSFTPKQVYPTGYSLVKPILDRYPKKGLEYISRNPPHSTEVFELEEWREKTLEYLSN